MEQENGQAAAIGAELSKIPVIRRVAAFELSEFDPSSGKITWPDSLQAAEFGPARKQVESLFTLRANAQGAPGIVTDIRNSVDRIFASRIARKQIEHMAPSEYVICRISSIVWPTKSTLLPLKT